MALFLGFLEQHFGEAQYLANGIMQSVPGLGHA
jgi:hypothetical protein